MEILSNIIDFDSLKVYSAGAFSFIMNADGVNGAVSMLTGIAVLVYTVFRILNEVKKYRGQKDSE